MVDESLFPPRIARLPRDPRGFPIPKFVQMVDGKPDFRLTSEEHWIKCAAFRRCWICGEQCGKHLAFVCGPSAAFQRVTSEPGSHLDCALGALRVCPFIMFPNRKRDDADDLADVKAEKVTVSDHNPGVWLLWTATTFAVRRHADSAVIAPGEPSELRWFKQNRPATFDEVWGAVAVSVRKNLAANPKFTEQGLVDKAMSFMERAR